MRPVIGRSAGKDAVIVGREPLRLHQRLASAIGAGGEVAMLRRATEERLRNRFARQSHLMHAAPAKIGDFFGMAESPARIDSGTNVAGIGSRGGVSAQQGDGQVVIVDHPGESAAPGAEKATVPFRERQPHFDGNFGVSSRVRLCNHPAECRQPGQHRITPRIRQVYLAGSRRARLDDGRIRKRKPGQIRALGGASRLLAGRDGRCGQTQPHCDCDSFHAASAWCGHPSSTTNCLPATPSADSERQRRARKINTEQNKQKQNFEDEGEQKLLLPRREQRSGGELYLFLFRSSSILVDKRAKKAPILALILSTLLLRALPLIAQSNTGELRLTVTDPSGSGLKSTVQLVSDASQYRHTFTTDDHGNLDARRLPYGIYQVQIHAPAFAQLSESVDIRSALPLDRTIQLKVAAVSQSLTVSASATLIDPYRAGSVNEMGLETIQNRLTALPGRSMQDLVNSEPGWLYEGNAVLHPRGSEYQTQFVVDGIPLTDNRSPSFGPEVEADDAESLAIYTAGIPAEFGRKMGGVIEVNTLKNERPGFHGQLTFFGGSYDTGGVNTQDQYTWKGNTLGFSAGGNMTDHYLNPVIPQNYTNDGTRGSFSVSYEREITPKDRLTLIVRHELARYEIPNELVQQNGGFIPNGDNTTGCPSSGPEPADCVYVPRGQLQNGDNFETMGSAAYQHIFSENAIASFRAMGRDNSNDFYSNPASWPVIATQHNDFKEAYFNSSASVHHHWQEWKVGFESDAVFLHENFHDEIPDCADPSDPRCPITLGILDSGATTFSFKGDRPDLEQSAYVQDALRLGNWSVNAGLRWDHYQLLVNQNAVSPRVAISRYFSRAGVNIHGSYDRIFQTPSFENILLSSSKAAEALDTSVAAVQLPVQPSHGNYFELGATKAFAGKLRLDTNMFRRDVNNYADDSQVLSTGISFPIAFRKGILYGAEGKLELQKWGRFSGFASYAYIVGNVWNPVTGGLFLGDDATGATTELTGHFPDSQDQRNTVRDRIRFQAAPRLWFALGSDFNSGLPFEGDLTAQQYVTEYGQVVVNHLNFDRGRINPYITENASVGADLYTREKTSVRLQADAQNLSNKLEVIDFGGLFSGNALGPSRQYTLRLVTSF